MKAAIAILVLCAVLLVVMIAALRFQPANPLDTWFKLAQRYQTPRRPSDIQFTGQKLQFGVKRVNNLNDFARFDTTIDDFGLWIIYSNNGLEEVPSALKIPGTHVRYVGEHGRKHLFDLYAEPPIRMAASGEFGAALKERCQG